MEEGGDEECPLAVTFSLPCLLSGAVTVHLFSTGTTLSVQMQSFYVYLSYSECDHTIHTDDLQGFFPTLYLRHFLKNF